MLLFEHASDMQMNSLDLAFQLTLELCYAEMGTTHLAFMIPQESSTGQTAEQQWASLN